MSLSYEEFKDATRVFARSEATDSSGCVICTDSDTSCPKCKDDEECVQLSQTCDACPRSVCQKKDGESSSKSTPVGGIVGGVIGGLAVLGLIGGFLYYRYVYRKKHPVSLDDEDMAMSEYDYDYDYDYDDTSSGKQMHHYEQKLDEHMSPNQNGTDTTSTAGGGSAGGVGSVAGTVGGVAGVAGSGVANGNNESGDLEKQIPAQQVNQQTFNQQQRRPPASRSAQAAARRNRSNRRLSSYESFTRPKVKYETRDRRYNNSVRGHRGGRRGGRGGGTRGMSTNQPNVSNVYLDPQSNNRNSVATSISTTNASNILPIAYIPGVTVRPTRNNTRSVYSYETESIFSDLNTIENASIIGDVMRANNHNPNDQNNNNNSNAEEQNKPKDSTMTAIKAQPRLVNVDRIEEEEEEEEEEEDEDTDNDEESYTKSSNDLESRNTNNDTLINTSHEGSRIDLKLNIQNVDGDQTLPEEDESDDSDVDSDIGEITRATSVRRNNTITTNNSNTKNNVSDQRLVINNDDDAFVKPSIPRNDDDSSLQGSNNGSFILDVEIDNKDEKKRPQSDDSGEKSPFDDPE